ncbi:MAG: bifunctional pyr operon transcriptional regulator/uracil phosphoribosyltransferase PyrR [Saprospiraceae bacterium]|nr:bifunctional pyr operon transcriptional regulator/uracil phosphoribosyltransferase PyrR [Saprospiraceae bacterium]
MDAPRLIINKERFLLTIDRLCHELIENYGNFEDTCLIGIQDRGAILSDFIMERLKKLNKKVVPRYGKLDITFYRDDYRHREKPLKASSTTMDFLVEGKRVILVDDVLYSGRTVHAAMTAIQDFGRADQIAFLCLVDRRFNRHFPIRSDYTGIVVDTVDQTYVKVEWEHIHGQSQILLLNDKSLTV